MIFMKRLIAFALVLCLLLLCGCKAAIPTPSVPEKDPTQPPSAETPATEAPTEKPTEAPTEEPTEAPTEAPTEEPTEAPTEPELVTVYLLDTAFLFDSGPVEFTYDENYNMVGYTSCDMDEQVIFTGHFAQPDANGMPSRYGVVWYDGTIGEDRVLTWSADGKLQEEQVGENFTGTQYAYDEQGRLLEKRDYYEGMLEDATYYAYSGNTLTACWCEIISGDKIFDCVVENGRIVEQNFYDYLVPYGYTYEYDKAGNLIQSTFIFDGESTPGTEYTYIQVQVSPERAQYLQEQQRYLHTLV